MANTVTASIADIDDLRIAMKEQFDALAENQKSLRESIEALSNMWEGPAHDEFHRSFLQENDRLEKVVENGRKLCLFEENAVKEYDKADAIVEQELNSSFGPTGAGLNDLTLKVNSMW